MRRKKTSERDGTKILDKKNEIFFLVKQKKN